MKKLLSIFLFFMAFSLVGFANEYTVKSTTTDVKIEQQKKCAADCTKACCAKKDAKVKKCGTECTKACCAKKDAKVKKCGTNCTKPCCAKKSKVKTNSKAKKSSCSKKRSSCCGKK